jgi:hypothetical protein
MDKINRFSSAFSLVDSRFIFMATPEGQIEAGNTLPRGFDKTKMERSPDGNVFDYGSSFSGGGLELKFNKKATPEGMMPDRLIILDGENSVKSSMLDKVLLRGWEEKVSDAGKKNEVMGLAKQLYAHQEAFKAIDGAKSSPNFGPGIYYLDFLATKIEGLESQIRQLAGATDVLAKDESVDASIKNAKEEARKLASLF